MIGFPQKDSRIEHRTALITAAVMGKIEVREEKEEDKHDVA